LNGKVVGLSFHMEEEYHPLPNQYGVVPALEFDAVLFL
jgi:hypothetical protein